MGAGNRDYYQRIYQKHYIVIHHPVAADKLRPARLDIHQQPWSIVFTGSIYWAQRQTLEWLVCVLDQMSGVNLEIYSGSSQGSLGDSVLRSSQKVQFHFLEYSEITRAYAQADIMLLPLSFHGVADDIIQTALPGKFSEYLISGVPMLIIAPPEAYVSRYAKQHDCALVVDRLDSTVLQQAIWRLTHDISLRKRLIDNAQALARSDFDAQTNSMKLCDALFL